MERVVARVDQHGRMLIPAHIRAELGIHPGERVTLEINNGLIKVINFSDIIDQAHAIFTKNRPSKQGSRVDEFLKQRREEYLIEERRERERCQK